MSELIKDGKVCGCMEMKFLNKMKEDKKMTLAEFREFAHKMHKDRGYKYDEHEYGFHTDMVAANVRKYAHLLPPHIDPIDMEMAAQGHDLIEDCGITFNDIRKISNKKVAKYILLVSNVPGEDRVERFLLTAPKIRREIAGIFLKICDTMANMEHSKNNGSSMYEKYKSEHAIFKYVFYNKSKNIFQEMWDDLEKIME